MEKYAILSFNKEVHRWQAKYEGKLLCQSQDKERVVRLIEDGLCNKACRIGVREVREAFNVALDMGNRHTRSTTSQNPQIHHPVHVPEHPHFGITERFQFLTDYTNMIINGDINSLLVTGEGGLGKTYTAMKCFQDAGLINAVTRLDDVRKNGGKLSEYGDFITVKGYSTAKYMYRMLYDFREKILVFDDCDKVLEDKTGLMILKSALDSDALRTITWGAERFIDDDDLPNQFNFKGQVIFISNKLQSQIDQAILSRVVSVDLSMTTEEKLIRIESVLESLLADQPEYSMVMKQEVLEFLRKHSARATDLNFRTFEKVCRIRKANPHSWEKSALYTMTATSTGR